MKQQDIAILIIIVFFAGIFAFVISSKFVTPSNQKLTAETVAPITSEFTLPSDKIFNINAINPTAHVEVGSNENDQPFVND